jgi:hypothetical protein
MFFNRAYERRAATTIQAARRAAMRAPRNDTHTGTMIPLTTISKPVAKRLDARNCRERCRKAAARARQKRKQPQTER